MKIKRKHSLNTGCAVEIVGCLLINSAFHSVPLAEEGQQDVTTISKKYIARSQISAKHNKNTTGVHDGKCR